MFLPDRRVGLRSAEFYGSSFLCTAHCALLWLQSWRPWRELNPHLPVFQEVFVLVDPTWA